MPVPYSSWVEILTKYKVQICTGNPKNHSDKTKLNKRALWQFD